MLLHYSWLGCEYVLFAVVTTGVVERAVEVEVVRLKLSYAQYLLLAARRQAVHLLLQTLDRLALCIPRLRIKA